MKEGISRRQALKEGFAAAVAAVTMGIPKNADAQKANATKVSSWKAEIIPHKSDFEPLLDRGKHMKYWCEQLENFQRKLRSDTAMREVLDNPDPAELKKVIKAAFEEHPPCFFDMLNKDTKEKVQKFYQKRSLWLTSRYGRLEFIPTGRVHEKSIPQLVQTSMYRSTGNAMPMRVKNEKNGYDYYIQTNAHMIHLADPRPEVRERAMQLIKDTSLDIAFYRVTPKYLIDIGIDPSDAVDISENLPASFNWQGFPMFAYGFDPDMSTQGPRYPEGYKGWFGMAHEVKDGMLAVHHAVNNMHTPAWELEGMSHQYMFLLDNGEADLRTRHYPRNPKTGAETPSQPYRYAQGMSGLGITSMVHNKVEYCGTLVMGGTVPEEGRPLPRSWASFEGRPRVRRALSNLAHIFELPPGNQT